MILTVDIGNSLIKTAVFSGYNNIIVDILSNADKDNIANIVKKYKPCKAIISSVVKDGDTEIKALIKPYINDVYILDGKMKLPFDNLYGTPETLGKDRIAAVAGAQAMFPHKNVLVIDAGSAITYDFLHVGEKYLGGDIAPGLAMRFKALNHYTSRLPLVQVNPEITFPGNTTVDAIASGVFNGMIFEIEGYRNFCTKKWGKINTVITGGDSIYFVNKLKNPIFANPNLVFLGLKRILEYNEN